MAACSAGRSEAELLDHVVAFLQRREGIDKTLKVIRYTARLVAASSPSGGALHTRCASLEKSIGVSRKAYRLGKFLQDIQYLRKSQSTGYVALLELLAYGGEGTYYFIEQLVWLIKAGALSKENGAQLAQISAWAELIGYAANIWISVIKLRNIKKEEDMLVIALAKRSAEHARDSVRSADRSCHTASPPDIASLELKLAAVRLAHVLRVGAIVQDLADSVLALSDVRGGQDKLLSHPATLALAGLISGSISFYKNWKT